MVFWEWVNAFGTVAFYTYFSGCFFLHGKKTFVFVVVGKFWGGDFGSSQEKCKQAHCHSNEGYIYKKRVVFFG